MAQAILCVTGYRTLGIRLRQHGALAELEEAGWCRPASGIREGARPRRENWTAARIVGLLADHGWLEPVPGGAVVADIIRREVWAIYGKGAPA
jgi:hypothetical protein